MALGYVRLALLGVLSGLGVYAGIVCSVEACTMCCLVHGDLVSSPQAEVNWTHKDHRASTCLRRANMT